MQTRILVPDTASAAVLADRLTAAPGSERISLPRGPRVQRRLDQARIGFVELRLGERSYSLARLSPSELWR